MISFLKDPKQTDGFTTSEMQTIKNFKQDFEDRLEAVKEYSGIYYSNYVLSQLVFVYSNLNHTSFDCI